MVIVLVGNKTDRAQQRVVSYMEANQFAQEHRIMLVEASAASGEGVNDAFMRCAQTILARIESGQIDPETVGSGIQYANNDSVIQRLQDSRYDARSGRCCFSSG